MSSVSMATNFPKNRHCRSCAHKRRSKRAAKLLFQMRIGEIGACSACASWFLVTIARRWPGGAGGRPVEGRQRHNMGGGLGLSDAAVNVAARRPKAPPRPRRALANGTVANSWRRRAMFHGCGAVLSYWCLVSAADGSTAPTVERSEMGSKDRMYLAVALGAISARGAAAVRDAASRRTDPAGACEPAIRADERRERV
jgi:hypothetical protein